MNIIRCINGVNVEFTLTPAEVYSAYQEFDRQDIKDTIKFSMSSIFDGRDLEHATDNTFIPELNRTFNFVDLNKVYDFVNIAMNDNCLLEKMMFNALKKIERLHDQRQDAIISSINEELTDYMKKDEHLENEIEVEIPLREADPENNTER